MPKIKGVKTTQLIFFKYLFITIFLLNDKLIKKGLI